MERRGSELLKQRYKDGGFVVDERLIEQLSRVLEGLEIINVNIKGTPRPDFLSVSVDVDDPERCGTLVKAWGQVVAEHGAQGIPAVVKLFPRGIPWPEAFNARLEFGAG